MHSIGAIAAGAATGLANLSAQLPWAWFALMALVDVALVVVVIRRRRKARAGRLSESQAPPLRSETLVLRSGWRVPRSRVLAMRPSRTTYAWPLHNEYMVSR
ncbi:MAG TPA: hypothetical protein VLO10_04235, partial [Candidatus Deferrimicrobium sp.]|nr:hypothetical protein [Candidatus Deferrimicrobium sp.]